MAKYGRKASQKVERAMRERKRGTLRSGGSGKRVTSRKQAIAIGLSEARRAGAKVPKKQRIERPQAEGRRADAQSWRQPALASAALLPDPAQVDDHFDGLLHVLHRHPLEPRVKVVLAGEEVRRRQPHERQPRAVGAAANRSRADRRARRAGHRLAGVCR